MALMGVNTVEKITPDLIETGEIANVKKRA